MSFSVPEVSGLLNDYDFGQITARVLCCSQKGMAAAVNAMDGAFNPPEPASGCQWVKKPPFLRHRPIGARRALRSAAGPPRFCSAGQFQVPTESRCRRQNAASGTVPRQYLRLAGN